MHFYVWSRTRETNFLCRGVLFFFFFLARQSNQNTIHASLISIFSHRPLRQYLFLYFRRASDDLYYIVMFFSTNKIKLMWCTENTVCIIYAYNVYDIARTTQHKLARSKVRIYLWSSVGKKYVAESLEPDLKT